VTVIINIAVWYRHVKTVLVSIIAFSFLFAMQLTV